MKLLVERAIHEEENPHLSVNEYDEYILVDQVRAYAHEDLGELTLPNQNMRDDAIRILKAFGVAPENVRLFVVLRAY